MQRTKKGNTKTLATKETPATAPGEPAVKRAHKATWARDKKKGGYLIRVIGPNAARFAGRDVPVTRMDDTETVETLDGLIWSGTDEDTGRPVALYSYIEHERESAADDLPF